MYDASIFTSDDDSFSSEEVFVEKIPAVNIHRIQHTVEIDKIKVQMPVKPYPCQEMVIQAIISGCNSQKNCLIESPTGSGKTLALSCGVLAWIEDYVQKMEVETLKRQRDRETAKNAPPLQACDENLDNDLLIEFDDGDWAEDAEFAQAPSSTAIPKVFYCSRTHKQLEQVVSELRKTVYGQMINMTVLSSREFSCIQESDRNKTKLCNELLDPSKKIGCCFYSEENKYVLGSFDRLRQCGVETPWDIEDLVAAGKKEKACPYYAARNLMPAADLILCPYNYIIDHNIRESMQINVTGSIIILDEAHNIEEVCRDSGSVSLSINQLDTIASNCMGVQKKAAKHNRTGDVYYAFTIQQYCQNLSMFILKTPKKKEYFETYSIGRWTSADFLNTLGQNPSLSPEAMKSFISAVRDADKAKAMERDAIRMNLHYTTALDGDNLRVLEKLTWALQMITSEKHASDYRMFVKQCFGNYSDFSIEFICMNPGVIFAPLSTLARSIILASGTLAPMSTYEGELGAKFPFVIQADHVTPAQNVLIKCVETNSEGQPLKANFENINMTKFQDDIGETILTACRSVDHGILVFLSSYSVLDKMCSRWKSTGMWQKMSTMKTIFNETRGSGDATEMMDCYRAAIRRTSEGPLENITGALLFAVFRGKVAEGIDFSDNEARCVITIGIPFAVRKNPAIDLKCRYNDLNLGKGSPSGIEWYTVNAFRALNQALGRAIRHQNDWAAIIMVDSRIAEYRYTVLLPNWLKKMWFRNTEREQDLGSLLSEFVARRQRRVSA